MFDFMPDEIDQKKLERQNKFAKRLKGEQNDRFNLHWQVTNLDPMPYYGPSWNQWRNMWNEKHLIRTYPRHGRKEEAVALNRMVRHKVKVHLRRFEEIDPCQYERKMPYLD